MDTLYEFEFFDEPIWNKLMSSLERKKGWKRVEIIERLYPLSGTFNKAKELFDSYYIEVNIFFLSS